MLIVLILNVRRQSLTAAFPIANLLRLSIACNILNKFFTVPADACSFMVAKLQSKCAKYCQRLDKFSVPRCSLTYTTHSARTFGTSLSSILTDRIIPPGYVGKLHSEKPTDDSRTSAGSGERSCVVRSKDSSGYYYESLSGLSCRRGGVVNSTPRKKVVSSTLW